MKNKNHKKSEKPVTSPKLSFFRALIGMFISGGKDEKTANRKAYHQVFMEGGNPEYYPQKHTVMGYAKQNRLAKKRRKAKTHV